MTAKHVLQDDKDQYFPKIFVRLNRKGKRPGIIPINLKEYKLHFHEDEIVDIAILMFYPDQNIFDFLYIPMSYLPDKNKVFELMNEGDDIFYSALFTEYYGTANNHPILRFGKVSLLTDEKIEVNERNKPEQWRSNNYQLTFRYPL